jgi:diguanylate cyclase (GGDEF)-like protein/PAS domain S-box-containing protein
MAKDGRIFPMNGSDDDWVTGERALLSALASIPGVSVIVFDREMRIRALHGAALARHGYAHERMIGSRTPDVMPAPVWERLAPLYARALAGETVTFQHRSEDGTATYESTVSPVRRDSRVIAGTITSRDISAQTTAEHDLSEATGRLQAILDHSPMAIYMRDLDQRWIVANRETCGILGTSAEHLLGRRLADTLPAALAAELAANDRKVMDSGEAQSFEEIVPDSRTSTGRDRHVWSLKFPVRDADGLVVGLGGVSLDVTDRDRASRELDAARSRFETMFASAPVGMLVSRVNDDDTTEVIQCNPAFARLLGREPEELLGKVTTLIHPDDLPVRARMLAEVLAGGSASGEMRYRHRDGHDVYTLTVPSMTLGPDGERLIVLQAVDISERKALEERLQHLADRDSLTDLFSRRRFLAELEQAVSRARRNGHAILLMLDLDGFKQVNDSFGHSAGDELLVRIAEALRRTLRESDVLARIGGDEFALILPDTDVAGGRCVAAKLAGAVRAHGRVATAGRRADVTASIGITSISGEAELDAAKLLIEADIAMYQAKEAGNDRIAVYAGIDAAAHV